MSSLLGATTALSNLGLRSIPGPKNWPIVGALPHYFPIIGINNSIIKYIPTITIIYIKIATVNLWYIKSVYSVCSSRI